MKNLNG